MRDDFSPKTKEELAKRVAYRCSNPQCRKPTIGAKENDNGTVSIGEAAHICAAAPGGKRYDVNMSTEERTAIDNGIWLCRNCAAMIDRDEKYYSVEMLQIWKQLAETEANQNIAIGRNYIEQIPLSNNDKIVVEKIIQTIENSNTSYMLKEHNYQDDFQRNLLEPIFNLNDYLNKPSSTISNQKLRSTVQKFIGSLNELRYLIALKGGPSRHGNGSYEIDRSEDQNIANNLCNDIWKVYESIVMVYRSFN